MRGVIGASFNEKKFGSVGSKLDNNAKSNMPLDKNRGGGGNQVKKQKDNFQMSQVNFENNSEQFRKSKLRRRKTSHNRH